MPPTGLFRRVHGPPVRGARSSRVPEAKIWQTLDALLLEDRILLNAAPIDASLVPLLSGEGEGEIAAGAAAGATVSDGALPAEPQVEIAFVDPTAGDAEHFLRDLQAQLDAGRNIEIVLLDGGRDGMKQITDRLAARAAEELPHFDAIHIIAHGNERSVRLGSDWLRVDTFEARLDEFARWDAALADGGDVLFYSCDLAATEAGRTMLQTLALAVGGNVAASTDATGAASLGGNWTLEFSTGSVEASLAVSAEAQQEFGGLLATFTVTNTSDSGPGSLRQAILDANTTPGADVIDFNIPLGDPGHFYYRDDGIAGSLTNIATTTLNDAAIGDFDPDYPSASYSWYSISLSSALPSISEAVTIDGTTQPGFSLFPVIELDGNSLAAHGLELTAGGNTIRGLVVNQFGWSGVQITSGDGNVLQGNFIGTDVSGTLNLGNGIDGLNIRSANNSIGGTTPSARNIISGNQDDGINLNSASGNVILGNYIGVDFTGTRLLGNGSDGVLIESSSNNNTVGGTAAGEANVIAGSGGDGVAVAGSSTGNSIRGNSIHSNTGLGIDLANNGVTANDPNDADGGDNFRQNFPVVTSAVTDGATTTISGTLNSAPGTTFELDFYASIAGDGSGHGEGQTYLGSDTVVTDGTGSGSFTVVLSAAVSPGAVISATATDPSGNTSEFAANFAATSVPQATDDPLDFHDLTSSLAPVGYWRLGESGGSTAVDETGGNDGTYNGPTLAEPGALAGDEDTAAAFVSADGDYVEIPHSAAYLLASGSIQLWFNTSTPAQDGALFSKDHTGLGTGGHLTIWLDGSGQLQVRLQSDTGDNSVSTSAAVSADEWHHVVFTFGSDGMRLYLDGQLVDTNAYTGGLGSTSGGAGNFEPIAIGGGTRNSSVGTVSPINQLFDGLMDEVAIFDVALSAEQVQNLNASAAQVYTTSEGGTLNVSAAGGVLANDYDPDGDPLSAVLVSGPSNAAAFTLNADGSFSYTHDGSGTLVDTFTYRADDGSSTSGVATVTITVTPVNDAPLLDNSGDMMLTDVVEDDTDPAGDSVADILASAGGDRITDPDAGAMEGIAVIGADNTNGQWQYDAGSGWIDFGSVSSSSAVLLDTTALVRFVPNANFSGPAGDIKFRAWDQTDGNASGDAGVDVSTNGGSTAYSTATETATLTILTTNDPPLLDLDADDSSGVPGADFAAAFTEDGGSVAIADNDAALSDLDSANLSSLTVTISNLLDGAAESLAADTSGTSTSASYDSASGVLSLTGADSVANYQQVLRTVVYDNASSAPDTTARSITFVAHDGTDGSNVATTTLMITAVNDAPVLDSSGDMTLTNILEDDANPAGDTVASIIASAGGDRITDPDAGALEGMAVIGVDDSNGQWQYNAGGGWIAFGAVANDNAVLLDTAARIRFVPIANYAGPAGDILFRAWDQTDGNASGDAGVDVSTNGGATAYSSASETATLSVAAINDAPVNSVPGAQATHEGTPLVFSTAGGNPISIADADAGGNAIEVSLNTTNGALTLAQSFGLAFSVGDGTADASMTFTGSISDINAALDGLLYEPDRGYSGGDVLSIISNDQGHSGGAPLTDADSVAISVTFLGSPPVARNDSVQLFAAPSLTVPAAGVLENDSDVDGQPLSASLVSGPQHGSVTLSADGSFTYFAKPGFYGFDTFRYEADDGILTSAPATVTVLVVPGVGLPPGGGSGDSADSGEEFAATDPDEGQRDGDYHDSREEDASDNNQYVGGSPVAGGESSRRFAPPTMVEPLPIAGNESAAAALAQMLVLRGAQVDVYSAAAERSAPVGSGSVTGAARPGNYAGAHDTLASLSEALDFDASVLFDRLDRLEDSLDEHAQTLDWIIGTTTTVTSVLTAGSVVWLMRGGYLFAGLLSSMPAWYRFDPLPVLQSAGATWSSFVERNEDDSLEDLVDDGSPKRPVQGDDIGRSGENAGVKTA